MIVELALMHVNTTNADFMNFGSHLQDKKYLSAIQLLLSLYSVMLNE
jgi:hypothetical protein